MLLSHLDALCRVGLDPELWRFTSSKVATREDMLEYIETALQWQRDGTAQPFVIIEKSSGEIIGSTRYANIDKVNLRLEIGWTWIARAWQRTAINTEMKCLMLIHAFEKLGCISVELKTNVLNMKSRNAMLRIGAKEEGIFRNHLIGKDGAIRHTAWYSFIKSEWPRVKAHLQELMEQKHS